MSSSSGWDSGAIWDDGITHFACGCVFTDGACVLCTAHEVQSRFPDPLWMRLVAYLSTVDWWALGTAAILGVFGGALVAIWYR